MRWIYTQGLYQDVISHLFYPSMSLTDQATHPCWPLTTLVWNLGSCLLNMQEATTWGKTSNPQLRAKLLLLFLNAIQCFIDIITCNSQCVSSHTEFVRVRWILVCNASVWAWEWICSRVNIDINDRKRYSTLIIIYGLAR